MSSETRGQQKLSSREAVYDIWLENSIPSTNGRNGQSQITISKRKFLLHADLNNKEVVVEEKINKRGKKAMTANKFIATSIARAIQEKLRFNNIDVSIFSIISLKPFYVNYATKKEMTLCLCKICLNTRLVFEAVMKEEKKQGGVPFSSISKFFMTDCECERSPNGCFSWSLRRVTGNCKQYQNNQYISSALRQKTNPLVTFSQFELTNTPYQQKDKQGNMTEKISKEISILGHKFFWIFLRTFPNSLNMKYSHLISTKNNTLYNELLCMIKKEINISTTYQIILNIILLSLSVL